MAWYIGNNVGGTTSTENVEEDVPSKLWCISTKAHGVTSPRSQFQYNKVNGLFFQDFDGAICGRDRLCEVFMACLKYCRLGSGAV